MTIESATYIDDLDATYPAYNDKKSEGDDHIRLIKSVLKTTFPGISGAVTPTHTELNYVDGVTSAIQTQINTINASLAATLFPNVNATVNTSDEELNFVDGVTSAIQPQIDGKLSLSPALGTYVNTGAGTLTFLGAFSFGSSTTAAEVSCYSDITINKPLDETVYPTIINPALKNVKLLWFAQQSLNSGVACTLDFGTYPSFEVSLTADCTITLDFTSTLFGVDAKNAVVDGRIILLGHSSSAYTPTFAAADDLTVIWSGGSAPSGLPAGDIRLVRVQVINSRFLLSYQDYPA